MRTCSSCGNTVAEQDGRLLEDGRFFCNEAKCKEKFFIETYELKMKPHLIQQNAEILARLGSGVCDICNGKVTSPDGYLLTTREVVSTPAYWQHYYQYHKGEFDVLGVLSFDGFCQNPLLRASCVNAVAGQRTPWMVCENCISKFAVDREKTRAYARQWWQNRAFQPPGNGPAALSEVNMGVSVGSFPSAGMAKPLAFQLTKQWWEFWKK